MRLLGNQALGYDTRLPRSALQQRTTDKADAARLPPRFKHPVGTNLAIAELQRKYTALGMTRELQTINTQLCHLQEGKMSHRPTGHGTPSARHHHAAEPVLCHYRAIHFMRRRTGTPLPDPPHPCHHLLADSGLRPDRLISDDGVRPITSRAPHQGGRWERMVQTMKRALKAIGGTALLREDEFLTFLAQSCRPPQHAPCELLHQG